jgi:sugar phosphate permease
MSHAALSMLSIALLVPVLAGHRALGDAGAAGEVLMLALAGALLVGPESLLSGVAAQEAGGPAAAASATGFVNGLGSFGAILQVLVVPPLAARFGWTALFPVLGALALGAMVALLPTLRGSSGKATLRD